MFSESCDALQLHVNKKSINEKKNVGKSCETRNKRNRRCAVLRLSSVALRAGEGGGGDETVTAELEWSCGVLHLCVLYGRGGQKLW